MALAKAIAQVGGEATQGEARGADPVEWRLEDDACLDPLGTPARSDGSRVVPASQVLEPLPDRAELGTDRRVRQVGELRHRRQAKEREALARGGIGRQQGQWQVAELRTLEGAERGRRVLALEAGQPGGQRRQPAVVADPAADGERRHGPGQHRGARRDPAFRAPQRGEAGDLDDRDAGIDRLDSRREVVEGVEHPLEGRHVRLRLPQLRPDEGEQTHHATLGGPMRMRSRASSADGQPAAVPSQS